MTAPPLPSPVLGRDLAAFGDRVAVVTDGGELTYRELDRRVAQAARRLGDGRRLVLLAAANTVDALVAYLGALAGGHVVLLAPGDNPAALDTLRAAYDPDVVVHEVRGRWRYHRRRADPGHRLHPDLALLLSTSGSTGSPKLVRLSHQNLAANADAIAAYLGIRDTDRAPTTLPLHYCYGLSVVHSHLRRGAGLVLTDRSVTDPEFWELFRRARATSLAGVPYTFALLDRVGFADMDLPHLRYVTQAGGRLAPDRVWHYAELGRRRGWDLFVMYGQTEATARMAYLPPDLAVTRPDAVGVPVPGGSLRLEPVEGQPCDVGELVYTGPNVMLGYAHGPADLALGRTVTDLRTGDLARRGPDGLVEIVGRRNRTAKVFGLRIDLSRVEAGLEADGTSACCVAGEDEIVVVVTHEPAPQLRSRVAAGAGLPTRAVRVLAVPELPRTATGKVDHAALTALAAATGTQTVGTQTSGAVPGRGDVTPAGGAPGSDLCALYAEVLDCREVTPDSTFVTLGGDSLSYVELSCRLEQALGRLPADWHVTPIRSLRPPVEARARRLRPRTVDTSVALRAVAIVLIVGTHIQLFTVRGGAHLLLAVAGFNVARFLLADTDRSLRVRHIAASIARIAVPTSLFAAVAVVLTDRFSWENVLLLNEAVGARHGDARSFWFIETLVYLLTALLLLTAVPAADRVERRWPFAVPVVLLAAGLLVRFDVVVVSHEMHLATPARLFWFFALGWATARAARWWQRLLVTAVAVASVVGYFTSPVRGTVVLVGLFLLIWLPHLPSTALLNRVAAVLAGASLYIYLTHWLVYPVFERHSRLLALLAALAAGVAFGAGVQRATVRLGRWWARGERPWRLRLGSANFRSATVSSPVPTRPEPTGPGRQGDHGATHVADAGADRRPRRSPAVRPGRVRGRRERRHAGRP